MSDQSPPPKPKVGSLRDRIAAFEKSATSASSAPAPPPPRPKPAGFSSWKPKPPSPPDSPSANASASSTSAAASMSRAGGMSASDAKESITKGASLKERMAALQGKGAFGTPPPVAPKPPLEKPKWKPPPTVAAPIDDDDNTDSGSLATADIAAAVERTISPPTAAKSPEPVEKSATEDGPEVESTGEALASQTAGEEEHETVLDPEEEERQRRAAIAARMARLGGARLGMGPPIIGKKPPPPPKKSTSIHEEDKRPVQAEPTKSPELVRSPEPIASPELVKSPEIKPTEDETRALVDEPALIEHIQSIEEEKAPVASYDTNLPTPSRKSSANVSAHAPEATEPQAPRVPTTMPVPSVPRRAGPPRKKPVKPVAPPPEAPEESMDVDAQPTTAVADEDIRPAVQEPKESEEIVEGHPKVQSELIDEEDSGLPQEKPPVEIEVDITEKAISDEMEVDHAPTEVRERSAEPEPMPKPVDAEIMGVESEPSPPLEVADDDDIDEVLSATAAPPPPAPLEATLEKATLEEADTLDAEDEGAQDERPDLHDEEDEEAARKRNIAERLAKMGGINPFGPPPVRSPPPLKSPPPTSPPPVAAVPSAELGPTSPPVAPASVPLPTSPPPQTVTAAPSQVETKGEAEESDESEYEDEDRAESPDAGDKKQPDSELPQMASSPPTHVKETAQIPISTSSLPSRSPEVDEQEDESYEEAATPAPPRSIPLSSHSTTEDSHLPPPPPARPAQLPPRKFVPQTPEERDDYDNEESDEEMNESMSTSRLFVPPPTGQRSRTLEHPGLRYLQDDDDVDGNGSESDIAPIPVPPQRSSMETLQARENAAAVIAARAGVVDSPRSPRSEYSETESDHDGQALPIPPRHLSGLHLPPPRLVPPPPPSHPPPHHVNQPEVSSALSVSDSLDDDDSGPPSPMTRMTPSVSLESEEILDESEGDPIDPSFHSPSRQGSHQDLRAVAATQSQTTLAVSTPLPTSPPLPNPASRPPPPPLRQAASSSLPPPPRRVSVPPPPPVASEHEEVYNEEDAEQARRRTIADRMAKLGGIKFGGAPPTRPPPPVRRPTQEVEENPTAENTQDTTEEQPADLTEEEEERARKERIATKLMGMGGMRIGMMPMGRPPVKSHILRDEHVSNIPSSHAPPARTVPPARPPPPPAPPVDEDSEYDSAAASEDGVKVEAEESEIEEVGYDDLAESQILEEVPPPPPSRVNRGAHRRESTEIPASPPASPPPPPARPSSRPPVPSVSTFTRRSSVQTMGPSTSNEPANQTHQPPSEYVMVEESEGQDIEEEQTPPPPPPTRPARPPPSRNTPQAPPPQAPNTSDSISSQWELPSIPTSSLDFVGNNDLTMSWTDAGELSNTGAEPTSSSVPQPPPARKSSTSASPDPQQFSSDELIVIWGRVGVQVCEAATSLFEKSKRSLIGDGSFAGFIHAALSVVPNVAPAALEGQSYGYLIYQQTGSSVQKRVSDIMPGDIVEIQDGKFKGHKGLQIYHREVGGNGETFLGVVGEFETKKMKMKVLQANQHVGQQTVESVSYKLEDLKSGIVKVYRVLEA